MTFNYKEYYLEPETHAPGRYNLYTESVVKSGKMKGVIVKNSKAYGVTIGNAISIITELEMAKSEECVPLLRYKDIVESHRKEILKAFDHEG